MQHTTNLNLNKPDDGDGFDVDHFNDNADILDDAIKGLRDSVSQASPGYTFTPYSGFTNLGSYVQRFGRLMILSVEVGTSTARAAGQVNVGKWSCTNLGGLGAARIATATANTAYEGVCQLAGTGEMRFYSSTANATKFWGVVLVMA